MKLSTCLFLVLIVMTSILLTPWPSTAIRDRFRGRAPRWCYRRDFYVLPDRTSCRQDGIWPCNHINCSKSDECGDCQQRCSGTMRNFTYHSLRSHKFILTVFWRNTHLNVKVNGILLVVSYTISLTVLENYLIQIINNSFQNISDIFDWLKPPANFYSS